MLNSSEWNYGGRVRLCALAFMLLAGGCNTDRTVTGSFSRDYTDRHPIRLTEGERSIQLLVGSGHGALTAEQRAQVTALAGAWRREGTGFLSIRVPTGTPNERAASHAVREVRSLLSASGVPPRAIVARSYRPPNPDDFGSIRIAYTRVVATAGPCGEWPEDLGASLTPSLQVTAPSIDNRPYWNFGCATQKNLAAAVANPEDLVQPRAETPPYASRRQQALDKYRQGQDPSSTYSKSTDAKVSDVK
jgi:pilus assembly protein CpaD